MHPFDSQDVVAALYRGVLGREASEPELGIWQAALDSGLSLDAVVQEFLRSLEFDIRSSGGNLTDGAKRELGRAAALGRIDVSPLPGSGASRLRPKRRNNMVCWLPVAKRSVLGSGTSRFPLSLLLWG